MNFLKTITSVVFALLFIGNFQAKADKKDKVPIDPNVKKGKLENGLTYYIRHNEVPENRAQFYLFVKAGAVQEDPEQNGLAHFCEHMAFNGTKHFPDKKVLDYMESIGVKFGHNVNAFTNKEQTVYSLAKVPTDKETIIDSSLLVLLDWANYVSYENEEIDKERGVIHEEWRTRRTPGFRMRIETNKTLYKGSKYANHDVIGKLDIIDNCSYEALKSFYEDWYRPDLQAIVVVGDVDEKQIEQKIKEKFSQIEMPENPRERKVEELPDNEEPLVGIATDKEASRSILQISYKHDPVENKDMDYYRESIKHDLYTQMFRDRLQEYTQKANPPFIYGTAYYGSLVESKDAYMSIAIPKNDQIDKALKTLLKENKRLKDHGFTQSELERNKKELLNNLKREYNNRNKTKSQKYIWKYLSNFTEDEPIPGIEFKYEFAQKVLPEVTLEEMNELPKEWITDKNMVVTINAVQTENSNVPAKEEVINTINEINNNEIEAYKEEAIDEALLNEVPKAGSVVKESKNQELGTTEWELDNGATVIIKPTDFKDNEILMSAYSKGGRSLLSLEETPSSRILPAIISQSGVGNFSHTELKKKLAGKSVSIRPYLNELSEGFSGNCEPKDLETLLKLNYLYMSNPRKDETAFNAYLSRVQASIANKSKDPNNVFRDSIQFIMAGHNPRKAPFNTEYLEKVNFETMMNIYEDRFKDASDFTYFFVGNIDPENAKPLIEQYIGGIKDIDRDENWRNLGIKPPKGKYTSAFKKEMKVPKASNFINFSGDFDYTYEDRVRMKAIEHILSLRYIETIREEQGGSYGVGVRQMTSHYPEASFNLLMMFDCDPKKQEQLLDILYEEVEKLYTEGPKQKDLEKAKKHFLKKREQELKENDFWLSSLKHNYIHSENILASENYEDIVNSLTVEDIKETAEKYLKNANTIDLRMSSKN
jgi:zinc protease